MRVEGSKKALASTRRDSRPQPPDDATMRCMSSATSNSDSTSGTVKADTDSTSAPGAKDMAGGRSGVRGKIRQYWRDGGMAERASQRDAGIAEQGKQRRYIVLLKTRAEYQSVSVAEQCAKFSAALPLRSRLRRRSMIRFDSDPGGPCVYFGPHVNAGPCKRLGSPLEPGHLSGRDAGSLASNNVKKPSRFTTKDERCIDIRVTRISLHKRTHHRRARSAERRSDAFKSLEHLLTAHLAFFGPSDPIRP